MSTNKFQYWPSDGQLGLTKFTMPTNAEDWPSGDALVGNFVYSEGKLVDFVDTRAFTANDSKTTTFPYDYVNITVDKSLEGVMTFNKGSAKYFTVTYSGSGNNGDTVIFKYMGCKTVDDIKAVDPNYKTTDIIDGVWSERLGDLTDGESMFEYCSSLTSFSSDLSNLINGGWMFCECTALTSFNSDLSSLTEARSMFDSCPNLTSFNIELPSLTNGFGMFGYCYQLTSFNIELPNLRDGRNMFFQCSNLASFNIELPSLTEGNTMFKDCAKLTSFNSNLPSLATGDRMFSGCSVLTSFSSDLPSLTTAEKMFEKCTALTSFNADLSSLTYVNMMFCQCPNLTSFSSDLSSLTNGNLMFDRCPNLTSFNADLSSLTNGNLMLYDSKLDTASVQNIADTINTVTNKPSIHIGIGNSTPNEQEITAFNTIASKGWTVYVNGRLYTPTSTSSIMTLDEYGNEVETPIPFWAKPVSSDEEHAQYTDSEGNFYNILGGQFIYGDDISTYGMFTSLEDAAAQMRLTKIEK